MAKTASKRRKVNMPYGIRKKLTAALCMLLIGATMMISSTYAWFTLSTAPEVTGITTNVGANGNLEIALLNSTSWGSSADDLGIRSDIGDSMENKAVELANETWGNLVDLSPALYGLQNIILNPAAMNVDADGSIKDGLNTLLLAPSYGSDGRVISVQKPTVVGLYNQVSQKFNESTSIAGVRAIGTSSGITERISQYRSAVSSIVTFMNGAKQAAARSLVNNGQQLANILMGYVTAGGAYVIKDVELAALQNAVDELEAANENVGAAIKKAALAYTLSAANSTDLSDEQVNALVAAVNAAEISGLSSVANIGDLSFLGTAIAQYNDNKTKINSVKGVVNGLGTGATYASASSAMEGLLNKQYTAVGGVMNPSSEAVGDIASDAMSKGAIDVTMYDGSGIYADIAKLVGDYTASGLKLSISYESIAVNNMDAVMRTQVGGPALLTTASTTAAGGDFTGSSGATTIDTTFGYVLDFGFRTNAAGSSLLLQNEAAQRIYDDTEVARTQGSGTYIEFTSIDPNFTASDVKKLMSAVRVVFVEPETDGYKILAVAAPQIKYTLTNDGTLTFTMEDGLTVTENEDDTTTVKAQLAFWSYSFTEIVADTEYSMTLGDRKTDESGEVLDYTITDLDQNKAKKISVLVYLDGDQVDNTMVSNGTKSATGKLNLQFASSAELKPMENAALRDDEGGSSTPATSQTITKEQLSAAIATIKANAVYTAAANASEPDAAQSALLNAVTTAETVVANEDATETQIQNAVTTLGAACVQAGITSPF